MKVDYNKIIKEQRGLELLKVKKDIKTKAMQIKIKNYAEKYGLQTNYVEQKILDDSNFASFFAKDPSRQGIHEKIAAEYIRTLKLDYFRVLPKGGKNALYPAFNGVDNTNEYNVKSLDFEIKIGQVNIYTICKHTDQEGGAQDNQYNDVLQTIKAIKKTNELKNIKYVAILDGEYYRRKNRLDFLNKISENRVRCMSIEDLDLYLEEIKDET